MRKLELHWQILIAIILAAIVGGWVFNTQTATGVEPTLGGVRFVAIFEYIGTMFLNALKITAKKKAFIDTQLKRDGKVRPVR